MTAHVLLPSPPTRERSVEKRGFFDGLKSTSTEYERRFRKVVNMFRQKMDTMIGDRPIAAAQAMPMPLSHSDSNLDGGAGAVVLRPNTLNGKKKARKGNSVEIPLVEVKKENDDATDELLSPIPTVHSAKRIRGGRRKSVLETDEQHLAEIETPCSSSRTGYSNPVDTNPQVVPLRSIPAEERLPSMPPSTPREEVRR